MRQRSTSYVFNEMVLYELNHALEAGQEMIDRLGNAENFGVDVPKIGRLEDVLHKAHKAIDGTRVLRDIYASELSSAKRGSFPHLIVNEPADTNP